MPFGKPAGMRCVQLDDHDQCRLFGKPDRPVFCASLKPQAAMCGGSREAAFSILDALELATRP